MARCDFNLDRCGISFPVADPRDCHSGGRLAALLEFGHGLFRRTCLSSGFYVVPCTADGSAGNSGCGGAVRGCARRAAVGSALADRIGGRGGSLNAGLVAVFSGASPNNGGLRRDDSSISDVTGSGTSRRIRFVLATAHRASKVVGASVVCRCQRLRSDGGSIERPLESSVIPFRSRWNLRDTTRMAPPGRIHHAAMPSIRAVSTRRRGGAAPPASPDCPAPSAAV